MSNITELEACWTQRMADFDKRLEAASSPSNSTLLQLAEEFKAFKDIVRNMFNVLHHDLRDCFKVVDALDMRQRQKILLFNGIPEDPNVEVKGMIPKLIQEKMGLPNFTIDSIKRCHRLGNLSDNHIRPVLIHFKYHNTKTEIWRSKAKLKGSGFTVTEFLTKARQAIHKKARRHFGMKNVWTFDGVIHIKPPGGCHEKIVTEEELDGLILRYPDTVGSSESVVVSSEAQHKGGRQQETRRKPQSTAAPGDEIKRPRRVGLKK